MASHPSHLLRGFWSTSLGTLASRAMGLVRDMVTAALVGLAAGGVMDAFVVAFRLVNLPRRILGEGALSVSLVPALAREKDRDPRRAWQLASGVLAVLAIVLGAIVLLGEVLCAVAWRLSGPDAPARMIFGLAAILLPYLWFVCLAAQVSAVLQTWGEFRRPALAALALNVCWLVAAWLVAPRVAGPFARVAVIAAAVVISGVVQLAVQWPALGRLGFRFAWNWQESSASVQQVARMMLPIAFGLAVTQLNALGDSLIAWGLAAEAGAQETIAWLGDAVYYPLERGAAAAIYYGERFYQLPVGVLGVAVATVIYPRLARHAGRGTQHTARDVTQALQHVWFLALPASVGLMLLAEPAMRLLFERGAFTPRDTQRAAAMIACYAAGVGAYCALPVLVRAYYAVGDTATPVRLGMVAAGFDLAANLVLVWPLGERGLAISTAVTAMLQAALLTALFSRKHAMLDGALLRTTIGKGAAAALFMAAVLVACEHTWRAAGMPVWQQALALSVQIILGSLAYGAAAWLLRMDSWTALAGSLPVTAARRSRLRRRARIQMRSPGRAGG